jgi:putative N6-adenine-specific DNA methylase
MEKTNNALAEFYLICLPGLEELVRAELETWLPLAANPGPKAGPKTGPKIEVERGGVTAYLPLGQGLALNRVLKTPTRILLRLAKFGCRDFPKLFRKLSGFDWQDWVADGAPVEFVASSHRSWLKIKRRIEETANDAYKASLKKRGLTPRSMPTETILLRIDGDVCTVSLDTSGELLHKRGYRPLSSDAPLRETIASALLLMLERSAPQTNKVELIDPMTGGGTFLLEAAGLRRPVSSRGFAYEHNPVLMKRAKDLPNLRSTSPDPYVSFVGYDLDEKALIAAQGNWSQIREARPVQWERRDFVHAPFLTPGVERWLIANPPYGERIRVEGRLKDYYERLLEAAFEVAHPTRACFLCPEKVRPLTLRLPRGWVIADETAFSNGGLPVRAIVYKIQRFI